MKRIALYFGLTATLVASCSTREMDLQTPIQDNVVFYASFEQPTEEGTRVYANEDLLLRWTADDRVSIFNRITYNQQYQFTGETGDNAGGFRKVDTDEFVTGNTIPHVVSVYPYQETTKITESEVITVTLPEEQTYAENTFGLVANTMVSVSSDNVLQYKNVGGFLKISLYGAGAVVNSITLKGNKGEKLAGKAIVTMPIEGSPNIIMANDATDEIRLVFETAIALGNTAEESKDFWFVIPPVEFKEGFTIVVSGPTCHLEKSTTKDLTIERNKLSKMSPVEVEASIDNNCIIYTSTDGANIFLNRDAFGATIVSNEYNNGYGIITFDGDVTSIGNWAFSDCSGLTSITIPNSVTSIGEYAFYDCTGLTSITIPNSVTSIGPGSFSGCTSLTSITIPDGVTSIGDWAFLGCTSLTSITLPNSVTSIGNSVFNGCTGLTSITISDGVTSIGNYAFSNCSNLTSITIPDSVTSIGNYAFSNCSSLTSITIPDGVTSIGDGVFSSCSSMKSFKGRYASPDGYFLINLGSIIAVAYASIEGSITIPDSVTSIGNSAFAGCTSLTSITIPDGVTSIGDSAFYGCTGLTSITILGSVTSIGESTFQYCTSLTSITIPDGVTSIGGFAFAFCFGLTSITIPDGVTSIGDWAFSNCSSLTSITIPDGATSIGRYAFGHCSSLTSIIIPDSMTSIGDYAFFECTSLTSIIIPDSMTTIGRYVFGKCTSLTSVIIPNSVTSIESTAFCVCTSLTSISIPNSVTSIGSAAFRDCTGLTSITIPDSVTSIGSSAFRDCTGLTSIIVLPETPPQCGSYVFWGTNDCPIYVPAESVDAYKTAEHWDEYASRFQAIPE